MELKTLSDNFVTEEKRRVEFYNFYFGTRIESPHELIA